VKAGAIPEWLKLIGCKTIEPGTKWIQADCPLAPWRHKSGRDKHPSFGIKIGPGDSHAYCFSCHWSGSQTELLFELDNRGVEFDFATALRMIQQSEDESGIVDLSDVDYEAQRFSTPDLHKFPESYVENFEPAHYAGHDAHVHPYLRERGVSYEFAKQFDLRFDPIKGAIVFPIRDYQGDLYGCHGRIIAPEGHRKYHAYGHQEHRNPHIWLGEHLVDRDCPVVFVESVFDLARVWEIYENVITPMRSGINKEQLDRVRWVREVIVMFDNDEAGRKGVEKIRKYLRKQDGYIVHIVWPPEGQDPGDLSDEEIATMLYPYLGG
jgi:DNA primase